MTRAAWIAALLLVGCATLEEPDWLQTLRAREAAPMRPEAFESPDGFFRARVPARLAAPVEREADTWRVRLDAGASSAIDCWVHSDSLDLAASVAAMSEAAFQAVAQNSGEIELRSVDHVDAGAFAASPFLAIDWLYRIEGDEGPRLGQVKHLALNRRGRGIYCLHDEIGYAETFRRVVAGLAASIRYAEPAPRPYFSQVSTLAIRGMRVGVEYTTLLRDAEGDTRVDTRTSLLVPIDGQTLQTSDSLGVEFARPDGALINQVHVALANGDLVSHLELDPHPDGHWAVSGTFQTKPLSAQIQASRPPTSWLGEALALRETLARGGREITLGRWVPQADPTRLLEQTLSIGAPLGPDRFAATLAVADLRADLVVERSGSVASGSIEMGLASLEIERVYVDGAF